MKSFRTWHEARQHKDAPGQQTLWSQFDMEPKKVALPSKGDLFKRIEELKKRQPGFMILVRMGDFYEMFGEDAEKAAKVLGLIITKRGDLPMSGFPYHMLERSLHKLLVAGVRVAIADAEG